MELKKKLTIEIKQTPETHDTNDVWWYEVGKTEYVGHGYQSKKDGKLFIERCPMCEKENYAINIPTGTCAWCGYDANHKE